MNLLHRHIFLNVLLTCGAAVGVLAFVLMIGNALKDLLPHILAGQLEAGMIIRLVLLMVPFVLAYALPMGMLTGCLLVLGRMSSDREITALRASGLSVAWVSAPILFLALLGVIVTALINFQFMPVTRLAQQRELAAAVSQNPMSFIVPKTFIRDFPGVVIYVGEKNGAELKDFWIWELDDKNRVKHFGRAETAHLDYNETENKMVLTAFQVRGEFRNGKDPENFAQMSGGGASDQASFDLPLGKLTGEHIVQKKLKWYTFRQLLAEWHRLKASDPNVSAEEREKQLMRVQITIHEKFATAFSVLSFTLVAIPLGIKVSRKETSANLGMGVALALAYFFGTIVVGWFDGHPALRPDLLMWLPNLAFQALGFRMFYKVDRS